MKKYLQINLVSLLLLLLVAAAQAQDARFSQYYNNPLLVNSSLAGNGIEHIRITAIYRNQWAGMGTPFTTQGLSVDKVVNRVGIGATILRNGAGDASIKTMNVLGNLSYHLPLGAAKNHTLSGGVQVGVINKSFDPSKLTFDNQYNPDQGYDPTLNSGEVFSNTSVTRPDVNLGFVWQRGWLKKDIKFKPFLGIGWSHITKPVETFIADEIQIPVKQTIYGGAGFLVTDRTEIRPSLMTLSQGTFNETIFGSSLNYQLDNKNSIQIGAFNRIDDAVIAYAGYQMNLLFIGMSYDINTGELSKTGKGTNAFEISLTYSPRQKKKKTPSENSTDNDSLSADNIAAAIPVRVNEITQYIDQQVIARNNENLFGIDMPVAQSTAKQNKSNAGDKSTTATEKAKEPVALKPVSKSSAINDETTETKKATAPSKEIVAPVTVEKTIASNIKTDSDKDGIPDDEDECPYIKGGKATRGCPDSDGDGIIDMNDDCPLEAGPKTNNGCPDPNKPSMKTDHELVKTFNHILFATGSTRLTTDDIFDIIERAVDVLYADKSTYVLLSGHTDSEGDEMFNMKLSEDRNSIVKAYLLKQGIDESRIQTVAYGETMPLKDNILAASKKQNRRVELNIVRNK